VTEQQKRQGQPEVRRVPNGHSYCWAEHKPTGGRCIQPRGHSGKHYDPYAPSVSW